MLALLCVSLTASLIASAAAARSRWTL
jgi:hypothetical protein